MSDFFWCGFNSGSRWNLPKKSLYKWKPHRPRHLKCKTHGFRTKMRIEQQKNAKNSCSLSPPHMQELPQKLEGVETVDPPSLSRRIRREFPDLTSPQTKSASRQLLSEIRRKLDLRVPRRPRAFVRLVRNRTTSKVSYHAPLYGYAFSRIRSTPQPLARLATPCQGQVTRASKPATLINNHRTPKSPSFLTRLRNRARLPISGPFIAKAP